MLEAAEFGEFVAISTSWRLKV
jgi:hypothetical protein